MIRQKVITEISQIFKRSELKLLIPKHSEFGDFAIFSKERVDTNLLEKIKKNRLFDKAEATGNYINLFISGRALLGELKKIIIQKDQYGSIKQDKKIRFLIEHTSPNPNKAMHLGHLRNNVLGMSIANIWKFIGIDVIRDCVDNNRGIAIARLMWGYLKFGHKGGRKITDVNYWYSHQDQWKAPKDLNVSPDRFVDSLYVRASDDYGLHKETQEAVGKMVVDWEAEDKKIWALWKKVLSYSYEGQAYTLKRLGNVWDKIWHEHEHYKMGKDIVREGLKRGDFKKTKEGTVITNLKKYGLTDTVLIKSDGTSLYITQDIALTKLKKETFRPDKLFWVIGPEQSFALKQLFAVCDQLGIGKYSDFTHISYGWMSIKGKGRMSSRSGNVVYIDDLLNEAVEKAKKLINESKISKAGLSPENIDKIAEKIGVGAVKYSLLKVAKDKSVVFDYNDSITFSGNSGPYLQYTYARCQSILAKAQDTNQKKQIIYKSKISDVNQSITDQEKCLLRALSRFPDVVQDAAASYSPHLICTYLNSVAQKFNLFYEKCPVLNAEQKSRSFRLTLVEATGQILKTGLNLLGIEVMNKL